MRKASLFIQLTTSIAFIFCTIVMLRQVHFLRNNDWGYAIKGRAQLGIVSTRNPNQLFSVDFIRDSVSNALQTSTRSVFELTTTATAMSMSASAATY